MVHFTYQRVGQVGIFKLICIYIIDKQKALRRDCIYNIENMDLEIGVSGVYLHLL